MGVSKHNIFSLGEVFRNEGMRGLYRGYTVTAFCTPMFHTIYFPMYEKIKMVYKKEMGFEENSFALYALASGSAGALCNCISNPFWMVRTRMQAEIFRSSSEANYQTKYPLNIFKAMRIIAKNEGFFTLYQGLQPSMVGLMHPIIYFPLYEKSKIYFKQNWDTDNKKDSLSP